MELIGWILAFIIAITIHEASHAWMANRLGDPTARLMGRLSLNPIVHYDPVGTTLLLVLVFMRAVLHIPVIPFGWAKPVIIDPYNLRRPRRDSAIVSLAGPLANLLFALLASIIIRLSFFAFGSYGALSLVLIPAIILNIVLAIFNLIPIHPLDGGKIFIGLLPEHEAREADNFLRRYGMIILLFLIFPTFGGSSPISALMSPIIDFVLKILLPGSAFT
ncbi:hypothetical protein A2955_02850 [Candidatus Woesebacteria bacterium RIFCSPLOWO2_01_FULL_37_19]|uniref:Peptidase M50 domain-containing protein n=2 Tax=Candidatus Woeseibacteriota TaxID=1752722 RepID=A0A1F8BAQ4_9BACT|nr:MAG: hypothetical protein A2771_00030 [Candidatus Woesebacteria bacterium RIFCSPHIGHO2_01_FULL_38_26b]OGM61111.1 MAG: hypothetical protein A2955_02850 [Candidatus Woesebacteria bacterium RIFCSPLOWO2_01_FULL_37_19]